MKDNQPNPFEKKYVLEIPIFNIENGFPFLKDVYGTTDKIEILKKAQETNCDILGLKFNIDAETEIDEAAGLLTTLLPHIKKPLMIRGINKSAIDIKLLPELIKVLDRESIAAFADENTFKTIVPEVVKGNHTLVLRSPIDINLAKELNILSNDLGLSLNKIFIDPDIGGLGYGFEYGYSIMEKIKLENDEYLNMPIITFAAEESLKTKEAKSDNLPKSRGSLTSRIKMYELASAAAVCAAGASIIVLNYPENINTMKGLQ